MAFRKFNLAQLASGVIIPLLVLVIGFGAYFLLLPKYRDLQGGRKALAQKKSEASLRAAELSNIQKLVLELEQKKAKLEILEETLPTAPRIPELLANFEYLAKQSGLLITDLQITVVPSTVSSSAGQEVAVFEGTENLGVMQVEVSFTGQYRNLKNLLLNLEQNQRLMDVEAMILSSPGEDSKQQEYTFKIQTYYQKS